MHFEVHGRTDPKAETILFSSGLGGLGKYWQPQMRAMADYKLVTYDQFGTGRSKGTLPEEYSISKMADDVITILDELKIEKCNFVGHALGGLIGLDLALRQPMRLTRLVVVNAWAKVDSHTLRCFSVRKDLLLKCGVEAYVHAQPIFLYPADYLSQKAKQIAKEEAHHVANFQGTDTLLKRIGALESFDVSAKLGNITIPTLVMAAKDDVLVPWSASKNLAKKIRKARFTCVDFGGHGYNVTEPELFNGELLRFLKTS
jgi:aminoacrylate hydrolase